MWVRVSVLPNKTNRMYKSENLDGNSKLHILMHTPNRNFIICCKFTRKQKWKVILSFFLSREPLYIEDSSANALPEKKEMSKNIAFFAICCSSHYINSRMYGEKKNNSRYNVLFLYELYNLLKYLNMNPLKKKFEKSFFPPWCPSAYLLDN